MSGAAGGVGGVEPRPTEPRPTDEALARLFLSSGDAAAFVTLVSRYRDRLRRLLWVILRSVEDVEDAEQEVLAGLYRSLGSFRFRSSFRTFLYRFARNKALDLRRRRSREQRRLEAAGQAARMQAAADPPEDPDFGLQREERRRALWAALGSLSDRERVLVLLKDVEDWSIEEIGAALSLPGGTVKSRLHRAREKLLALLGGAP